MDGAPQVPDEGTQQINRAVGLMGAACAERQKNNGQWSADCLRQKIPSGPEDSPGLLRQRHPFATHDAL